VAMDTHGSIDRSVAAYGRRSNRASRRGDPNEFSAVLGGTLSVTMGSTLSMLAASDGPRMLVLDVPALAVASESTASGDARAAHADAVRRLDQRDPP